MPLPFDDWIDTSQLDRNTVVIHYPETRVYLLDSAGFAGVLAVPHHDTETLT